MTKQHKLIVLAMCLGTFIVMLDTTIMNIALPSIQNQFSVTLSDLSLPLNAYTILFASLTIPLGKLANIFGKKSFYLYALFLFALGSLVSGLSQTIFWLTLGRILQSIGAAVIFPLSMDMAISSQKDIYRSKATLIVGITQGSASAFGPTIGGTLIHFLGWRWIFLINIPIALFSLLLTLFYLPSVNEKIENTKIDWLGTMGMVIGLFTLTLFLINIRSEGLSLLMLSLLFVSLLSFIFFIWHEKRISNPVIDFSLFQSSNFNMATIGTILGQILLVGFMVLMPTFFENIFHKTALQAALLITPSTFMIFLLSPFAGKLIKKVRPYYLLAFGFLTIGLGYLGLSFLQLPFNYIFYIICSIFIGAGYGLIVGPISVLSTSDFRGSRLTVSQSVIGVLRQLGTVLATTLFISGLTYNLSLAKGLKDYISSFTSIYLYAAPVAFVLVLLFWYLPNKFINVRK
ncbi:MFS transporter [Streptococcus dentiloxodontae]